MAGREINAPSDRSVGSNRSLDGSVRFTSIEPVNRSIYSVRFKSIEWTDLSIDPFDPSGQINRLLARRARSITKTILTALSQLLMLPLLLLVLLAFLFFFPRWIDPFDPIGRINRSLQWPARCKNENNQTALLPLFLLLLLLMCKCIFPTAASPSRRRAGVCDCCDGSDEPREREDGSWSGWAMPCDPNGCAALLEAEQARAVEDYRRWSEWMLWFTTWTDHHLGRSR